MTHAAIWFFRFRRAGLCRLARALLISAAWAGSLRLATGAASNPSLLHTALDGGGGRSASTRCTMDGSLAGWGGIGQIASRSAVARQGFPAQLNEPPQTGPDMIERFPEQSVKAAVWSLLGNDADPENDPVTLLDVITPSPQGAEVAHIGGWVFYRPPAGFRGEDYLFYRVVDAWGQLALGTIRILTSTPEDPSVNYRLFWIGSNRLRLDFAGIPGRAYRIEWADAIDPPQTIWHFLAMAEANDLGWFSCEDSISPDIPHRFYRAVDPRNE